MFMKHGEVRRLGIEVISTTNQDFVIEAADYSIKKTDGEIVETGIPTIDEHKILALFSAQETGNYDCEFTYHIGPEILKANISVRVT